MRIRQFLAHLAKQTGEALGWVPIKLRTDEQALFVPISRIPNPKQFVEHDEHGYHSKIFHSDAWYLDDGDGMHLVSFGCGPSYIPHGYPSLAGTLLMAINEGRTMIQGNRGRHSKGSRQRRTLKGPNDILRQERYLHTTLLFGLADGTLGISDEHPFCAELQPLIQRHLPEVTRIEEYVFPGILAHSGKALTAPETIYRANFIPILAEKLVQCVITSTEGSGIKRPQLALVTTQQ